MAVTHGGLSREIATYTFLAISSSFIFEFGARMVQVKAKVTRHSHSNSPIDS